MTNLALNLGYINGVHNNRRVGHGAKLHVWNYWDSNLSLKAQQHIFQMGFIKPHQVTFSRVLNWLQIMPQKMRNILLFQDHEYWEKKIYFLNFNRILKRSPNYHRSAPPILPRPLEEPKYVNQFLGFEKTNIKILETTPSRNYFQDVEVCRLGTKTTKISFLGSICEAFGSAVVVVWRPLVWPNRIDFAMGFFYNNLGICCLGAKTTNFHFWKKLFDAMLRSFEAQFTIIK